jgi:hypothetical protein
MIQAEDIASQTAANAGDENRLSGVWLSLVFIISSLVACGIIIGLGHYFLQAPRTLWPFSRGLIGGPVNETPKAFENVQIASAGAYLKAALAEDGNPKQGEDFAVVVTFKLRRTPSEGESLALFGKFDADLPGKPGFALSLEGAPDGVRPRVYVSTDGGVARWHVFSSYPVNRRDWYVLGLSFSDDTFVSTRIFRAFSGDKPTLLGGHRLADGLPKSKAGMVLGAFGSSRFRGQVGPFGVLSGKGLSGRLAGYIQAAGSNLSGVPSALEQEDLILWGSPAVDLGPKKIEIMTVQSTVARPEQYTNKQIKNRPVNQLKRVTPAKKAPTKSAKKKRKL